MAVASEAGFDVHTGVAFSPLLFMGLLSSYDSFLPPQPVADPSTLVPKSWPEKQQQRRVAQKPEQLEAFAK